MVEAGTQQESRDLGDEFLSLHHDPYEPINQMAALKWLSTKAVNYRNDSEPFKRRSLTAL